MLDLKALKIALEALVTERRVPREKIIDAIEQEVAQLREGGFHDVRDGVVELVGRAGAAALELQGFDTVGNVDGRAVSEVERH